MIYSKSKEVQLAVAPAGPAEPSAAAEIEAAVTYISLGAVKEAALQDAAVSAADVTFTKAKLEYDGGIAEYDIEFYTATHEYEYEVDAVTGAIRDKSLEPYKTVPTGKENTSTGDIGLEEAKRIALERAGLSASQVTFKKAKLDREDGITVHEIEFVCNAVEYECEINAATGGILNYEWDRDD